MEVPDGLTFPQYLKHHLQNGTYFGLEFCEIENQPAGSYFKVPWNHFSNDNEKKMYTVSF